MSINEKQDREHNKIFESATSIYTSRITGYHEDSHMESVEHFRDGLSTYSLRDRTIKQGKNCKWNSQNCGGVPLDFDESTDTIYADGSDSHTLLIGATGTKKSRMVVMPAVRLLAAGAGESIVICDPKAEVYHRTSGFLKECGYDIHVINLRDPVTGDCWNIMDIPFQSYLEGNVDKAYEYINDQAAVLIPLDSKDPYWDFSSRDLYVGLTMLLFELVKESGLSQEAVNVQSLLQLKADLFTSTRTSEIKQNPIWHFAEKHDMIRNKLLGIVICPSDTMGCILSVFDQYLSCFSLQPKIIDLLSKTTFPLDRVGYDKTAIFLIMPDEKSTYHKLITVFIKQIYEFLIDQAYKDRMDSGFPRRVNFLLDEFSSLPTITDFPQMISASRSRNIRFTIIVQSKHQLKQRYGDETETIQSNCTNWMFLHSREVPLLQEISTLAGNKGQKPLIPVARLQHLDKEKGECLIFAGRLYPYIAKLTDISTYDHDAFDELPLTKREGSKGIQVSFAELLQQKDQMKTQSILDTSPFDFSRDTVSINDLVKKIDDKIAELETEEIVANQKDIGISAPPNDIHSKNSTGKPGFMNGIFGTFKKSTSERNAKED